MLTNIFSNLFRFFILLLVQILVLNRIEIPFLFTPLIYPLFLIRLPIDMPRWLLLCVAFGAGLCVDMFSDSMGINAAACVATVYFREGIFFLFRPPAGYEPMHKPTIGVMGARWFISVTVLLLFIHHVVFYLLQIFSFGLFFHLFIKLIFTTLLSILLIVLTEFLFFKKKPRTV